MATAPTRPRALVTGASSGVGEAYAERLARDGFDLVLVARRRERLEALAERLRRETGAQADVLAADLCDAGACAAVETRLAEDDVLQLLVNNAGFGGYRPFVQVDPAVAEDLVRVHVLAATRLTRAALPGMVRRGAGAVINVASLLALSGTLPPSPLPHRATYAGAKAYLVAFSQALAGELAGTGVKVQVCLPGLVATEFHTVQGIDRSRMPPMMSAADIVTASLAGLAAGEVCCVPGLVDASLLDRLAEAQLAVMRAANQPKLADRYVHSAS
jgi:short-subunit dehydrogenase